MVPTESETFMLSALSEPHEQGSTLSELCESAHRSALSEPCEISTEASQHASTISDMSMDASIFDHSDETSDSDYLPSDSNNSSNGAESSLKKSNPKEVSSSFESDSMSSYDRTGNDLTIWHLIKYSRMWWTEVNLTFFTLVDKTCHPQPPLLSPIRQLGLKSLSSTRVE